MPSGVYQRKEEHIEICRKAGLLSPTKFKKGHIVTTKIRDKISKTKTKQKHSNKDYSRVIARKKLGVKGSDTCVHHIDGNPLNNDINNLIIIDRSAHTKLHWIQGDIR